jgi:hypothetical protein
MSLHTRIFLSTGEMDLQIFILVKSGRSSLKPSFLIRSWSCRTRCSSWR